jgi:hypothetical protein
MLLWAELILVAAHKVGSKLIPVQFKTVVSVAGEATTEANWGWVRKILLQ